MTNEERQELKTELARLRFLERRNLATPFDRSKIFELKRRLAEDDWEHRNRVRRAFEKAESEKRS